MILAVCLKHGTCRTSMKLLEASMGFAAASLVAVGSSHGPAATEAVIELTNWAASVLAAASEYAAEHSDLEVTKVEIH